jgi:hypothetical protein
MPSQKVFIKCSRPFIHGQIRSEEAMDQLNLSRKSVGSYFANRFSTRKGTGLTDAEVQLLLPGLLNMPADSPEFRKEVDKFYTEISTNVPYEKGVEVEIGLEMDNSKPVTFYEEKPDPSNPEKKVKVFNMPMSLEDYIKYRHALAHPFTAASPKAARGNQTVMFYIEDPNETIKDAESDAEVQDKSAALYQQIKDDDRKIKAVINLLQHYVPKKPGEMFIPDLLTSEQRKLEVRKLAMGKYYRQFYATATDPDVFNRYQLFELIRLNLLKRAGTSILVGESNEVLGGNEKEALDNLYHNTANAQLLENLKAQAKDKIQKAALGK